MSLRANGLRNVGLIAFALILVPAIASIAVTLPILAEGQIKKGLGVGSIAFAVLILYMATPVVLSAGLTSIFWKKLREHRFLVFLLGGLTGTLVLFAVLNFWLALMLGFFPSAISAIIALDWRDAALKRSRKTDA